MADSFGITDAGIVVPRTADFRDRIRAQFRAELRIAGQPLPDDYDFDSDMLIGKLIDLTAAELGLAAGAVQAVWDAVDPANAYGALLDNQGVLSNVPRQGEKFSRVTLAATGDIGTSLPAGKVVRGGGDDGQATWITREDGTIKQTSILTGAISVSFSDLGGTGQIVRSSGSWHGDGVAVGTVLNVGGTSNNDGLYEVLSVTEDTVEVDDDGLVSESVPANISINVAYILADAEEAGAVSALPGAVTTITTPVDGWDAVTNTTAPLLGRKKEEDDDYRTRRLTSLQIPGSAAALAVSSALKELEFLTAVVVLENDEPVPKSLGGITVKANSLRPIVWPNTLTDAQKIQIVETIYPEVVGGIRVDATDVTATVTKADGFPKTIGFDFATIVTVNVVSTITLETGAVESQVEAEVKEQVQAYFDTLQVGEDVLEIRLDQFTGKVPGLRSISYTFNGGGDLTLEFAQISELGTNTVTL